VQFLMRNCTNPKNIEVDFIYVTNKKVHDTLILVVYSLVDDWVLN
jgi:hypothetical protein